MTDKLAYDAQTLEPGALVELLELDASILGGEIDRFHGYTQVGSIWWQGNEYKPWPVQLEGVEMTSDQQPTPTLSVGNVNGLISALCVYYDDMVGAQITTRGTLGKFLDAANFDDGNPTADPTQEFPSDIWFIERKASEDSEMVQFELSNALDFGGVQLPRRQIVPNQCAGVEYRGPDCGYAGPPVAKIDDTPTDDPALDRCSHRLSGCKLRNWPGGQLPFGGFPAASLIRT